MAEVCRSAGTLGPLGCSPVSSFPPEDPLEVESRFKPAMTTRPTPATQATKPLKLSTPNSLQPKNPRTNEPHEQKKPTKPSEPSTRPSHPTLSPPSSFWMVVAQRVVTPPGLCQSWIPISLHNERPCFLCGSGLLEPKPHPTLSPPWVLVFFFWGCLGGKTDGDSWFAWWFELIIIYQGHQFNPQPRRPIGPHPLPFSRTARRCQRPIPRRRERPLPAPPWTPKSRCWAQWRRWWPRGSARNPATKPLPQLIRCPQ